MGVYGVEAMSLTVDGRTRLAHRRTRAGETYRHTPFLPAYNARTRPFSLETSATEPPETVLGPHIQPIMTSLSSISRKCLFFPRFSGSAGFMLLMRAQPENGGISVVRLFLTSFLPILLVGFRFTSSV